MMNDQTTTREPSMVTPLGDSSAPKLVVSEDGARLLGALYGAGAAETLDQNRIFAAWLQRQVRSFAVPLRSGVHRAVGSCASCGFSLIDIDLLIS